MTKNTLSNDITEIKTRLGYITQTIQRIEENNVKYDSKLSAVETKNAVLENKVGALAIFQSTFSIIVGAVASYLGIRK